MQCNEWTLLNGTFRAFRDLLKSFITGRGGQWGGGANLDFGHPPFRHQCIGCHKFQCSNIGWQRFQCSNVGWHRLGQHGFAQLVARAQTAPPSLLIFNHIFRCWPTNVVTPTLIFSWQRTSDMRLITLRQIPVYPNSSVLIFGWWSYPQMLSAVIFIWFHQEL